MTVERTLRIDALGRETQFVIVNHCITNYGRQKWEEYLTALALGYTKIDATGGWRGKEEAITLYRVASLTDAMIRDCVEFLLDAQHSPAIGRLMTDLYVIYPSGEAYGFCYEYPKATLPAQRYHGQTEASFLARQSPAMRAKLHGARDTGWNHNHRDDDWARD